MGKILPFPSIDKLPLELAVPGFGEYGCQIGAAVIWETIPGRILSVYHMPQARENHIAKGLLPIRAPGGEWDYHLEAAWSEAVRETVRLLTKDIFPKDICYPLLLPAVMIIWDPIFKEENPNGFLLLGGEYCEAVTPGKIDTELIPLLRFNVDESAEKNEPEDSLEEFEFEL